MITRILVGLDNNFYIQILIQIFFFYKALKNENLNVNKNSIKNFCSSSLLIEPIEKLLKV